MGEEDSGGEHGLGTSGQALEAWRPPESPDLAWGGPRWEAPLLGPHIVQCGPWITPASDSEPPHKCLGDGDGDGNGA